MDFSPPTPLSGPNVFKSGQKIPIGSAGLPSYFLVNQHILFIPPSDLYVQGRLSTREVLLGQTDGLSVAGAFDSREHKI